jgi:hypothetical protein
MLLLPLLLQLLLLLRTAHLSTCPCLLVVPCFLTLNHSQSML